MTIDLPSSLAAGDYSVEWVSIADDGDLLRGTVAFTVAAGSSPSAAATASAAATHRRPRPSNPPARHEPPERAGDARRRHARAVARLPG